MRREPARRGRRAYPVGRMARVTRPASVLHWVGPAAVLHWVGPASRRTGVVLRESARRGRRAYPVMRPGRRAYPVGWMVRVTDPASRKQTLWVGPPSRRTGRCADRALRGANLRGEDAAPTGGMDGANDTSGGGSPVGGSGVSQTDPMGRSSVSQTHPIGRSGVSPDRALRCANLRGGDAAPTREGLNPHPMGRSGVSPDRNSREPEILKP